MRIALLQSGWTNGLDRLRTYLTPTGDERWNDVEYVSNPRGGVFDGLVVCQAFRPLDGTFTFECPPSRTLLVVKEPPEVLMLPEEFTRQFACVVSQDPRIKGRGRILTHSAHHWFVEVSYAEAMSDAPRPKAKLLSAVTSSKVDTPGHRQRLRFLYALKEHFGPAFDWFGRGINDIGVEKRDGLLEYKYHICLENSQHPHYWTEKLVDAYISDCVPIYWGAPNIAKYFDPDSLIQINIYDIPGSINRIRQVIDKDLYSALREKLAIARRQILRDYHPYETYARIVRELPTSPPVPMTIRCHSECSFSFRQRMELRVNRVSTWIQDMSENRRTSSAARPTL